MCSIIDGLWDIMLAPLVKEVEQPMAQPVAEASATGTTEGTPNRHIEEQRNGWLAGLVPTGMMGRVGRIRRNLGFEAAQQGGKPTDEDGSEEPGTKPR